MRIPMLLLFALAASATLFASSVKITTATLPNGTVGTAYSATVAAVEGAKPYTWTVMGSLPPGVAFTAINNTQNLNLAGSPTVAGTYTFLVQVTGLYKAVSQVSYTVTIQPLPNHVVGLSWNASTSTDISGYNLYRGPDGVNWQKVNATGLIASTLFSDATVANGTTYYYAATAVDISGAESAKSASVEVAVP
jgi:hypothetical protein